MSLRMVKLVLQLGRKRVTTGGVVFLTRLPPSCQDSSFPEEGYVEDLGELRTTLEASFTIVSRLVKTVIQLGRRRVKTAGVPSWVR